MIANTPAWLYAALRSVAQALIPSFGGALAFLDRGVVIDALTAAAASFVFGVMVGLIRWLETRTGYRWPARLARGVATVIMWGLSRYQPVYGQSSPTTVATGVVVAPAGLRGSGSSNVVATLRE